MDRKKLEEMMSQLQAMQPQQIPVAAVKEDPNQAADAVTDVPQPVQTSEQNVAEVQKVVANPFTMTNPSEAITTQPQPDTPNEAARNELGKLQRMQDMMAKMQNLQETQDYIQGKAEMTQIPEQEIRGFNEGGIAMPEESAPQPPSLEQELRDALEKDRRNRTINMGLDALASGLSKMDAANPYANLKAIKPVKLAMPSELDEKLKIYKTLKDSKAGGKGSSFQQARSVVTKDNEPVIFNPSTGQYQTADGKPIEASKLKSAEERREKQFDTRMSEKDFDDTQKIIDKFNKDKVVEKAEVAKSQADQVIALVNSNNPIGHAAIPTFMARASGEVGNLSEADKAPFGGSRALTERIQQATKMYYDGTLTEDNRQFITDLANTMKKASQENIRKRAKFISKQKAGKKYSQDQIYEFFTGEQLPKEQPRSQQVPQASGGRSGYEAEINAAKSIEEINEIKKKYGVK